MYMVVTINPIDLSYIGHWDCEVGPSEESWSHCLLSSKQKHFYFRWASCRNSCACGLEALSRSSIFKTSTSFPATTTHTTSTKRFTCSMLCETMITVKPRVFFSWSTVSSMWCVEIGSSALVGSSRRRTCWMHGGQHLPKFEKTSWQDEKAIFKCQTIEQHKSIITKTHLRLISKSAGQSNSLSLSHRKTYDWLVCKWGIQICQTKQPSNCSFWQCLPFKGWPIAHIIPHGSCKRSNEKPQICTKLLTFFNWNHQLLLHLTIFLLFLHFSLEKS